MFDLGCSKADAKFTEAASTFTNMVLLILKSQSAVSKVSVLAR